MKKLDKKDPIRAKLMEVCQNHRIKIDDVPIAKNYRRIHVQSHGLVASIPYSPNFVPTPPDRANRADLLAFISNHLGIEMLKPLGDTFAAIVKALDHGSEAAAEKDQIAF